MQVLCGQCGKTIDVDDEQVGQTISCPACDHEITVPRFDEDVEADMEDSVYDLAAEEEGFAGQAKEAMARKVQVLCGSCGRNLSVSARLSGKHVRCPACGVKIRIPYPDEEAEEEKEREHETAAQSQRTERLDVGSAEAEFARAASQVEIRPRPVRQGGLSTRFWVVLASVAVGAVAVGVIVGAWLWASGNEAPPLDDSSQAEGRVAGVEPPPKPPPPTKPKAPVKPPPTRPAPKPTVTVLAGQLNEFAANGYFAARPGYVYWHITAEVKAGAKPMVFSSHGQDVTLSAGEKTFRSLGTKPDPDDPPMPGRKWRIVLSPQESQTLTFVFEVPSAVRSATLAVAAAPVAAIRTTEEPGVAPRKLAGVFRETPPRNLKPLLRDPVMRAIQSTPNQKLRLKSDGGKALLVSILGAGVNGVAKPGDAGTYDTVLYYEGNELACKLRPAAEGDELILYLADEPFHQMTYTRSGASPRRRPRRPRKPAPKPVRAKPKPSSEPSPAGTPATHKSRLPKDHGRKTIFDF